MMKLSVFLLMLLMETCSVSTYLAGENLAVQGTAAQSSVYGSGPADRAIDGNRSPTWGHGSCSHTNNDVNPWWRLTLSKTYKVFSVKITNRNEVPERLNGAEIRIGDSLVNNGADNPRFAVITSIPAAETAEFQFLNGMDGRYVYIGIPGREEYLTLCEVEVYGYLAPTVAGENLAVQGTAAQSSVYGSGPADRAIDGNRSPTWGHGSCTHTNNDVNPWWRLTLSKTYKVFSVKITNRNEVPERLNGAEIRIGDSLVNNGADNPRFAVITSIPAAETAEFQFLNGMDGRYVYIGIPGREEYLTLCEVEVYGYLAPTGENLAVQGTAAQSSVYGSGPADRAIDGNRSPTWGDGSCTHTNNDVNPWWRLTLSKTYKVFSVKITNRNEVPERLNGAEIRIGDSLVNNGADNPRFAVITSIPAAETAEFQFLNGMDGRYVYIGIPGREEYLTLCEVEVFGSALD
ncbi:uncharacterized protein LOC117491531 [Trematomus bernacchii]|uniref:uncharacterized protein LOC117491531 n=1 Tax=Trematomus bernacchii TaxID=40690 RepID=UPI00146B01CF|nr:uncharacterized protein LOC117491531 [Trematomus bernacchii]